MAFRHLSRRVASTGQRHFSSAPTGAAPKKTVFYDVHCELGGKMVEFAGYMLPVQFKDGVITNHVHCRTAAGLFDVSHMGQLRIHGKDAVKLIEHATCVDYEALKLDHSSLSVILNPEGGIIDDCIVTKRSNHVAVVVNGACKYNDMAHLNATIKDGKLDARIEYLGDDAPLIALQGPQAAAVLSRLTDARLDNWAFMSTRDIVVDGVRVSVSRSGYTGEDGFEISVPVANARKLMATLLAQKEVLPAGLGVRDSLRLEAGLCLYGHDLNTSISPIEAGLNFILTKRRRAAGGFVGFPTVERHLKNGVSRKRVGLLTAGPPARENSAIVDEKGAKVGVVTSGTFSPILKRPIAMGYVDTKSAEPGTKLKVQVRATEHAAEVTKMPFVPTKYFRPKA